MTKDRGSIDVMLIAAIVAVIVVSVGMWGVYEWGYTRGKVAEAKAWEEEKAQLVSELAQAKAEAATKIDDMMAAFEAGKEQGKTKFITIKEKGKSDVATYPVFSNPVCVLPDDSLRNLQSARRGMRSAADPGPAVAPVPATNGPSVGAPSRPVPSNAR